MCCFFFKQKTAYEMHISDWSSDVCSSDLSLYAALEASGVFPVSGTQRICAALATPTEAGMLSIAQSSEILRIERLTRDAKGTPVEFTRRSEEHTSELQSLMRISYAVFCLQKTKSTHEEA